MLIKIDSKSIYNTLQNISITNKHCSFELSIHQIILKKNDQFPQFEAAQLFSTLIIIRNVS